jgi:hypothetical protein
MDIVRVLRIIEYVGPRDLVETCLERSIHGTKIIRSNNTGFRIRATTLGEAAEVLSREEALEVVDAQG